MQRGMNSKRPQQDDSDASHPKRPKTFDIVSHGSHSGVPLAYRDYTIAWICALPLELAASRAMLDEQHPSQPGIAGDDNTYVLGRIHRHNVVMACLPGQYGTNNAAIVATNVKRSFPSIRATLMVGIAGGSPSQADLYLGDVVVGTRVIQYDMGKALGGGHFQETAIPKTPVPLLNSAVSTLRSKHVAHQFSDRIASLLRSRLPNLSRPDHPDRLFQASYEHHPLDAPTCDDCDLKELQPRAGRLSDVPKIHYGVIASANRVMRNGKERDEIARRHSAMCFEMEAAGMMDNVQCLPIRGICDYSDSHKDKVWQDYAAATAAAYARELLEVIPTIRTTHWDFISLQKDAYRDDVEAACRRDLRIVDPQHDMERIEKSKDKLLDDAYKWILGTPEYAAFTNWDNSGSECPPRRLLWIKGHAGTGKTMLMIGLIRQLSHQPVALSPALSFFFCQGTDAALNNATAVLRSLIWLLLLQQPCLISHLLQKYKESGVDLFRDYNAFIALSEAFRNMLKDPQLPPVYLAVDALDECTQGRSDLIHLISTSLILSQKVKWLLSSRPEVDLLAVLKDPSNSLVELDTQRLEEPVNAYINHKLMQLKYGEGYDDRVLAEVSYEVRKRAENTFLWVALVFKELSSVEGWDAVETVQSIPPGLTDLYGHMMARIDEGNERNRQRCKNVLAATFLVHRPLSLSELVVVAGLPAKINPRTIVDRCGSFLTIKDETVYLIHQSAKDYLGDNYTTRLQPAGVVQGHVDISIRAIDAMSSMLSRNMYNLDFGFKPENMTPPDPDPLAPLQYSCVFWADHLCSLNSDNSRLVGELTDDGKVFGFLKEYFLRWLESLSLIGKLSSGLLSIRKILRIAQVCC